MTRSCEEYARVMALVETGVPDGEVAVVTGVPRTTVRDWRLGRTSTHTSRQAGAECSHDPERLPPDAYSYLLGMYLGDGCISRHARTWRLRIFMDSAYPGLIDECAGTMRALVPGNRVGFHPRKHEQCTDVGMYWNHWPCLLPQHGVGKKHEREIRLEDWQQDLIDACTQAFVRGLIHSDGCRVVALDRGRPSIRYHFRNRSEDILMIYASALDTLRIPWTRPSRRDIAVYRKAATARMDEFIGPKR